MIAVTETAKEVFVQNQQDQNVFYFHLLTKKRKGTATEVNAVSRSVSEESIQQTSGVDRRDN